MKKENFGNSLFFVFLLIHFALFFSCSDDNIKKEIDDDLSTTIIVYSENPDAASSNLSSSGFSYKISETISASKIIADCNSSFLKAGYKINAIHYYKNLTTNSTEIPDNVSVDENDIVKSVKITLSNESFYVSDSELISYILTFNSNGGSGTVPANINAQYNEVITLSNPSLTKTGYIFSGWNINGTIYPPGSSVSNLTIRNGDIITAYAVWKTPCTIDSLPSSVSVTYNDSGIVFSTSGASRWQCGSVILESAQSFSINYSDYSSGTTYLIVVYVNGSSTPSVFSFLID